MPSLLRFTCILSLVLLVAACETEEKPTVVRTDIPFTKQGTLAFTSPEDSVLKTIDIEFAESDSARARGLMNRRSLSYNQGMIFLFPDEDMRSFWMANTPIPLDIMFVGADSQIVNIARHTRPLSQDQVLSTDSAQYVVEVRAGFADRFGITDSTHIRWSRQ